MSDESPTKHVELKTQDFGSSPLAYRLMPLALSVFALALSWWGLAQCDLPLIRFLRTVHIAWLQSSGEFGTLLGSGWTLACVSIGLLGVGFVAKSERLRAVGIQSLIAHALVGLVTQLIKRLIGRPRPRFAHGDDATFAPSILAGLDSLPSGHTSASFAVATVIAKYFPRVAVIVYGLASLVGVGRVVSGSHFPMDVAIGATLGVAGGLLVASPSPVRWRAAADGVVRVAPFIAAVFAVLWMAMQASGGASLDQMALTAGVVVALVGAGSRFYRQAIPSGSAPWVPTVPLSHALIAGGLALSTGSGLLLAVGCLIGLSLWMRGGVDHREPTGSEGPTPSARPGIRTYMSEGVRVMAVIMALVVVQGVRGILPIL